MVDRFKKKGMKDWICRFIHCGEILKLSANMPAMAILRGDNDGIQM